MTTTKPLHYRLENNQPQGAGKGQGEHHEEHPYSRLRPSQSRVGQLD
jgi:hypothetical protein